MMTKRLLTAILLTILLTLAASAQSIGPLKDRIQVTGWGQTYYAAAFGKGQITNRWSMVQQEVSLAAGVPPHLPDRAEPACTPHPDAGAIWVLKNVVPLPRPRR